MALKMSSHREGCMCPVCKRARGEIRKTKEHFGGTMNIELLGSLREWAQSHGTSLTSVIEEAVRLFLDLHRGKPAIETLIKAEKLLRGGPVKPVLREYSHEELQEFLEVDKISPELSQKIDRIVEK